MFRNGFTIIEILLAMFLLATGVVAISGVSLLATRTTLQIEKNTVAQAIANEAIEKIRAMPYAMVGSLPDGILAESGDESGPTIRYVQEVSQNQQDYKVTIDVVAADDDANGNLPTDTPLTFENADYKQIRIQVEPAQGTLIGSVVSAATTISNWPPDACVPGAPDACPAQEVPERPETYTFKDFYETRDFVNSTGMYTNIPSRYDSSDECNGGLRNDALTRQKVCELKGYNTVVSFGAGNWSPPSDNALAEWVPAENNFVLEEDDGDVCDYSGSYLKVLVCGDPKPILQCVTSLPCPAFGVCTDAYLARGYTPPDVQHPALCQSNLDCNTGYACNVESGQCELTGNPEDVCPA